MKHKIKHKLRGPGEKYVSAWERERMIEKRIGSGSPKVQKVESDGKDSDLECYDEPEGKPLHIYIDKETNQN